MMLQNPKTRWIRIIGKRNWQNWELRIRRYSEGTGVEIRLPLKITSEVPSETELMEKYIIRDIMRAKELVAFQRSSWVTGYKGDQDAEGNWSEKLLWQQSLRKILTEQRRQTIPLPLQNQIKITENTYIKVVITYDAIHDKRCSCQRWSNKHNGTWLSEWW